ncbi:hypothetical protein OAO18_06390 [Francisellaceae bacterium]|nr:hypothetical protein [Francisellaceae bacterium]
MTEDENDDLFINFTEDGIEVNSNKRCIINLEQSKKKMSLTSDEEIFLSAAEKSTMEMSSKGITLRFGDDVMIKLSDAGIEFSVGSSSSINLKSNDLCLKSGKVDLTGTSAVTVCSKASLDLKGSKINMS